MRPSHRVFRLAIVLGPVFVAGACARTRHESATAPAAAAPAALTRGFGPEVRSGIARLREVTAPFQVLDSAVAAGYPREVARCYADEHHGAMGFHHVNRASMDARIDADHPEILLYERAADGRYLLTGVEFILPFRFYSQDSTPPILYGQILRQELDLRYWYLHVWAWKENPSGLFADWNPTVSCPAP